MKELIIYIYHSYHGHGGRITETDIKILWGIYILFSLISLFTYGYSIYKYIKDKSKYKNFWEFIYGIEGPMACMAINLMHTLCTIGLGLFYGGYLISKLL